MERKGKARKGRKEMLQEGKYQNGEGINRLL